MPEPNRVLRVVFVDDEPMGRATLKSLLEKDAEVVIAAECANGTRAIEAVRSEKPDILFLDVQMPGMTGFDVVEALASDELPVVVFVTAYDQYALKAFDVNAVDYLLKPFDDERFEIALQRAKDQVRRESAADMGSKLAEVLAMVGDESARKTAEPARLSIHTEGRVQLVEIDTIQWIEAADQYVELHTTEGTHLMRHSMAALENSLDPERFLRIHRSAIVALSCIKTLESLPGGGARVLVGEGTWLPVSRARAPRVRERLG